MGIETYSGMRNRAEEREARLGDDLRLLKPIATSGRPGLRIRPCVPCDLSQTEHLRHHSRWGALDAYLSDLILEVVPSYAPKTKQVADALKAIARSDPGLALRVALAPTKADGVEEFRRAL